LKFNKNQIAVVFDGTPDGDNPHGQFTRAGEVRFKVAAARNAGVGALIIIARERNLKDDALARLRYDNAGEAGIPVLVISRDAASQMLVGPGSTFAEYIDSADVRKIPPAQPQTSDGFPSINKLQLLRLPPNQRTLTISTDVTRKDVPAYNVVGVLEGTDPVLKNEYIVIGAHYDHLGRGGEGSLAPRSGEIHHGADDNASGTAGMIELAPIFRAQKTKVKSTLLFFRF